MAAESFDTCCLLTCGCAFFLTALFGRLLFVIVSIQRKRNIDPGLITQRKTAVRTMVVIGSGGHTTEMLRLLSGLSDVYCPRLYVMATTDKMSEERVHTYETERRDEKNSKQYSIIKIPRSREVKQSYLTSVLTTVYACVFALPVVFSSFPDLILTNGPGTCIPICLTGFFIKVLGLKNITIVYIESICRVESLSLSAKILYYLADHLLVQWPELQKHYPVTKYIGKTV